MSGGEKRILVLGLDGYEASLGERYMAEGRMPNLARITKRASRAFLDHGPELYSGLTWEHFSTGRAPRDSGRWSAVDFDPRSYDARQSNTAMEPFAARMEGRTVVFDAPYCDLARAPGLNGFVGWGAHDPGVTRQSRPSNIESEIASRFGPYPAADCIYGFTWPSPARTKAVGDKLVRAVESRADIAHWMLAERLADWDMAVVVVAELHSVIEPMWHGVDPEHPLHDVPSSRAAGDAVARVHEAVDRLIGRLTDAFPDARIVLFAMHGMGPNKADVPAMVLLPELMFRHSFGRPLLQPRADWKDAFPAPLGESEGWEWAVKAQLGRDERAVGGATKRWRFLKARLQTALASSLSRAGGNPNPLDWMPAMAYRRHWPDMEAFALPAYYNGRVRINLDGRERKGRVALHDYRRVADGIEDLLGACRDPRTGAPAVDRIDRFRGDDPLAINGTEADLEVMFSGSASAWEHPVHGIIGPVPYRRTGGHTGTHGVAWFSGDGMEARDLGTRSSFDIVPTLFRLRGQPVPEGISGRPIMFGS